MSDTDVTAGPQKQNGADGHGPKGDHGRVDPPFDAGDEQSLIAFLDYHRATFAWKTSGLGRDGLAATVGVSSMTLGGLLKHLALNEDSWFRVRALGADEDQVWSGVDWDSDPDWEWRTAADDDPDGLRLLWTRSVDGARTALTEVLADGGLDQSARGWEKDSPAPSVRWIVTHMIEEYARHNGHADLIREAFDGQTGE